jgi:hypothetical protein
MTEDKTLTPPRDLSTRFADQGEALVMWAIWLGLSLATVGLIDGIIMAARRVLADCPNGTSFPAGTTNFVCYSHPEAGLGIAVAVISVMLGILIALCSVVATATVRARSTTRVTLPAS